MATFRQMLIRSNAEIKLDRADRISKAAWRAHSKLIMDLEAKRDAILEVMEAAKDLSTSNSRDSLNAINSFDAEAWVRNYHQNSVELELIERELKIAQANFDQLFDPSIDTDTGEVDIELPSGKKAE